MEELLSDPVAKGQPGHTLPDFTDLWSGPALCSRRSLIWRAGYALMEIAWAELSADSHVVICQAHPKKRISFFGSRRVLPGHQHGSPREKDEKLTSGQSRMQLQTSLQSWLLQI